MRRGHRAGRLARLDARVVPVLGRGIRALGRVGGRLAALSGSPGRATATAARRHPVPAVAAVAVVVAVALFLTTGGDTQEAVAPTPPPAAVTLPGDQLGPSAGSTVSAYLAAAARRRLDLPGSTATRLVAVVDFGSYLTPRAAESVLSGLDGVAPQVAYVRVPPPLDGPVHTLALTEGTSLAAQVQRLRVAQQELVLSYRKRVALARREPTAQNLQVVTDYRVVAQQARVDARNIGPTTGCVFALEVTGPPQSLQTLAGRSDVRVLDPAPPNVAVTNLQVVPLEPQVQGVVPPVEFSRVN